MYRISHQHVAAATMQRTVATHIHTFQIKVLPGILNYVTSSFKGWDARVHEAVEDPPKRSLVTVRPVDDFYA